MAPTALAIFSNQPPLPHGFSRDESGNFSPIDFPGADATRAFGINGTGAIVGAYAKVPGNAAFIGTCTNSNLATVEVAVHGFLRTASVQYFTLDPPNATGSKNAAVTRINDAGDVVGDYTPSSVTIGRVLGDTVTLLHNFIIRGNGNFTSFDVSIGGKTPTSVPLGINAAGEIVGLYQDAGGDHGFFGQP